MDALGRYYLFGDEKLKWDDAREYCSSHGGYLVEFHTQYEIDVITVMLKIFFPLDARYWSGGTRAASQTSWIWHHSVVPFNVTYWSGGEPNGNGGGLNWTLCMFIQPWNLRWDDISCMQLFYPLCQMT